MAVIVADRELYAQARTIRDALYTMAAACDHLAVTIDGVTAPHGGLESNLMRESLRERSREVEELAQRCRDMAKDVFLVTKTFISDIDTIDSFIY